MRMRDNLDCTVTATRLSQNREPACGVGQKGSDTDEGKPHESVPFSGNRE